MKAFLRGFFKAILWIAVSFILLLVVIGLIIRIPAIQKKVADYATSFISNKTHSRVELKNIRISFLKSVAIEGLYLEDLKRDTLIYAGSTKVNFSFKDLLKHRVHVISFTLDNANLNLNRNTTDSLFNYGFLLTAFADTARQVDTNVVKPQWRFSINRLIVNDLKVNFNDSTGSQFLHADIKEFKLKDASVDIQHQKVTLDNLYLSESEIHFSTKTQEPASEEIKNAFDVNHLDFKHLTLVATDISYSPGKTEASIKKFVAIDQNNFSITKFETRFMMDQNSLEAKKLKVITSNSSIDADLKIQYKSFETLKDSIQFLILNLDIQNVSIGNSDITYFNPQLKSLDFFKNGSNITTFSGVINGPVNDLSGKNIVIKTGFNTLLKTDFIISGLPSVRTALFNFPNLNIYSGRKDILMLAGSSIPVSISLPEKLNMQIVFKGKINSFESAIGVGSSYGSATVFASVDDKEHFRGKVKTSGFDLGSLLKNRSMFGNISLVAETEGHGLDKNTIAANLKAEVSEIRLNKYTYHNLTMEGTITGQELSVNVNLDDNNASFDLQALVNLNPGEEHYKFNLNLHGADLQKLNFTKEDLRVGLIASADLKGVSFDSLNGKALISNISIVRDVKKYAVDSVSVALINESGRSELSVTSTLIDIKYSGSVSPSDVPKVLGNYVNSYFVFSGSDSTALKKVSKQQNFNFEVKLHSHPILSEVIFPQLKEFQPGIITGSFDSQKSVLKLNVTVGKIVYGTTELSNLVAEVNSDVNEFNYKVFCTSVSSSQIKLDNFLFDGKIAGNKISAGLSSTDNKKNKKLLIRSQIIRDKTGYKLTLDKDNFYLMNSRWNIADDNYIEFGNDGFLIHHLFLDKADSQVNIASVHDKFKDDLNIGIKNFNLDEISKIIEKDSGLVKGKVDGNILLKRVNNTYGIIADASISNLVVHEVPIGNLNVKAENPTAERFNIDLKLTGAENNLTASGYFVTKGDQNPLNINASIQSLSMKTVEAFSMGTIRDASGTLSGNLVIAGNTSSPDITGKFLFNNAFLTPAALNSKLQLANETLLLKTDGVYFNSFKILDKNSHSVTIDGVVNMVHFRDFAFSLNVSSQDFLLFNTTSTDNKEFFGRMIIDSKIVIKGPVSLPVVNAKLKLKKGSNFTFAVSEKQLTTDRGEDVVEFNDLKELNPILYSKKEKQRSGLKGFDISSIIEIDKQATLRLLLDPSTTDSLVVKGDAALSFTIDRSGKMSLTGAYNLNEGSYLVSLESVIKRKFDIKSGSTIIWNGDPMDADVSIDAVYTVRAAPIDLVADQMSILSETDQNTGKQRYPFIVLLKLRGAILHPEISFEIQLRPEDTGILGGAVKAKLNVLNEDPSALNKQVFALLVLGRFVQENPFQTESDAASTAVRTTVGKFLSAQLNQWSSKIVPGMELNFDIQSYNDYQSGQPQGRTQLDIGLKKQLFNERLSVQVGGIVDVEGEKAKQNSASDITSDVTVEYKLAKDGRVRLKGFRRNQYEGAIEGQLVETGAGVLYVLDFKKWKELFHSAKSKRNSLKTRISNDTIDHK